MDVSHRFMCLNAWSPTHLTIWEEYGTFQEVESYWKMSLGMGFEVAVLFLLPECGFNVITQLPVLVSVSPNLLLLCFACWWRLLIHSWLPRTKITTHK